MSYATVDLLTGHLEGDGIADSSKLLSQLAERFCRRGLPRRHGSGYHRL